MNLLDTSQYRFFQVTGRLKLDDQEIEVWNPGHCPKDELPEGEAANQIIAERCAQWLANKYGASVTEWIEVTVTEQGPPSQLIEGRIEDLLGS